MSIPKATNFCVYIIRDEVEKEKDTLFIPKQGQVKPHRGKIFSIGSKVTDRDIIRGYKEGLKGIFHKGIGQEVDIDGTVYLVLEEIHIIGVI